MTLLDVQRLTKHWRHSPPHGVMLRRIAIALGVNFEDPKPDTSKYMNADEFSRLVQATDGGRTLVGG